MEYEELVSYLMLKSRGVSFREIDNALTDLADGCTIKIMDDASSTFIITKYIIDTNFETGVCKCEYKLQSKIV